MTVEALCSLELVAMDKQSLRHTLVNLKSTTDGQIVSLTGPKAAGAAAAVTTAGSPAVSGCVSEATGQLQQPLQMQQQQQHGPCSDSCSHSCSHSQSCTPLPYSSWLLTTHRQLVVRWAQLVAATLLAHLLHPLAAPCHLLTLCMLGAVLGLLWGMGRGGAPQHTQVGEVGDWVL